jgi:hypothetical protein
LEELKPSQALLRDHMEARRKEAKDWRDKIEGQLNIMVDILNHNYGIQDKRWAEQKNHNKKMGIQVVDIANGLNSFFKMQYDQNKETLSRLNFGIDGAIRHRDSVMDQFTMISQDNSGFHFRLKEIEEKIDRLLGDSFVLIKDKVPKTPKKSLEKAITKGYSLRKKPKVNYRNTNFKKGIQF